MCPNVAYAYMLSHAPFGKLGKLYPFLDIVLYAPYAYLWTGTSVLCAWQCSLHLFVTLFLNCFWYEINYGGPIRREKKTIILSNFPFHLEWLMRYMIVFGYKTVKLAPSEIVGGLVRIRGRKLCLYPLVPRSKWVLVACYTF